MARMSVATIDKPEFINITPCNPLISECEIKVMYVGENRNRSFITKEVATEMANTLPGCPIVGYYREDKEDFTDHGDKVIIDDTGIHFECMTRPYGFVAPNARVWFQKFDDTDEFGNITTREYLMTTGYLWTGQYPECKEVITSGKPHSMELDKDSVDGQWTKNQKTGIDFFIINDAVFSKLCILGDDVEPCFEESAITAPKISTSFTKDETEFRETLFSMMQELKFALKGEHNSMENINEKIDLETSYAKSEEEKEEKKFDLEQEAQVEEPVAEVAEVVEPEVEDSFAKKDDEEKEEEPAENEDRSKSEEDKEEDDDEEKKKFSKEEDKDDKSAEEKNKEDEEKEKKYSLLEEEFNSLNEKYSLLQAQYDELLAFKNQIEDEKKDTLINSFYMLSEEDKKEVIENKSKYSLDDIEAKLSIICVRKKVNFDLDKSSNFEENKKEESVITTFNLDSEVTSTPAWVSAVKNTKNSRNI